MPFRQIKPGKRIWPRIIVVGILLISFALLIRFGASIWLNRHLPQLELALTQATGLTTRIKGTASATLFPTPGFALGNIEMEHTGNLLLTAGEFRANFDLLPLLDGRLVTHEIDVDKLALRLTMDDGGRPVLPVLPPVSSQPKTKGLRPSVPDIVELHDSDLRVLSTDGKELYRLQRFNMALHPVRVQPLTGNASPQQEVAIYLNFQQARIQQLIIGPSQLKAQYRPGGLITDITDAAVFGGKADGTVSWISTDTEPRINAKLSINNFDAEQSVTLFRPDPLVKGKLNLQADLSSSGSTNDELIRHLSGSVRLTGNDLELISTNLDELVTRVINSQQYNLVDAAAYFFVGPFAASATKSRDVANVAEELKKPPTTPTKIVKLVSSWKLDKGGATAQDVALQTTRYRLALQGRVNLIKKEFDKIRIAVINNKGCAVASQRLDGPFSAPRTEKLNILATLARPLLGVLSQSAMLLTTTGCEPFYTGELLPDLSPTSPEKEQGAGKDVIDKPVD